MKKTLTAVLIFVSMLVSMPVRGAASEETLPYVAVTGFDEETDYMQLMRECAEDGSEYALMVGKLYEAQRNLKTGESTAFFDAEEPLTAIRLYTGELVTLGDYWITGYVPTCAHCCGKTNGVTASGEVATVGKSVAMYGQPFGTEILIDGLGSYQVHDRGVGPGKVDVTAETHEDCYAITGRYRVYKVVAPSP